MTHSNQHRPCPPEQELREILVYYYCLGLNDKKIAEQCLDHFPQGRYGLSASTVKRLRRKWELKSTRQQNHSFQSIAAAVAEIRRRHPTRGIENMRKALLKDYSMRVPRPLIANYLKQTEPDALAARRHLRFRRKRFWCAGVNDLWCQDQHDKWLRFGLFFHCSIDPFIGYNNWLKVWWTNKNPRLIARYYLEAARKMGGVPLVTQSDGGSENFGIANAHTVIRHRLDPSLNDTLQHRWMRKTHNIKSEINWSVFRRDFAPGFEDILESGVQNGWYDRYNLWEYYIFRWLAIPWIQAELDRWMLLRNQTAPRRNRHKILPHGIPELIRMKPEQFGSADFKVHVPPALLDEVEAIYAPPDHPVFQLVPHPLGERLMALYEGMGQPTVTDETFWTIYLELLQRFHATPWAQELAYLLLDHEERARRIEEEPMELLPGLKQLRMGDNVIGAHGHGARSNAEDSVGTSGHAGDSDSGTSNTTDTPQFYAAFTDSEYSDTDSE